MVRFKHLDFASVLRWLPGAIDDGDFHDALLRLHSQTQTFEHLKTPSAGTSESDMGTSQPSERSVCWN